jgi:hypothetical protein
MMDHRTAWRLPGQRHLIAISTHPYGLLDDIVPAARIKAAAWGAHVFGSAGRAYAPHAVDLVWTLAALDGKQK